MAGESYIGAAGARGVTRGLGETAIVTNPAEGWSIRTVGLSETPRSDLARNDAMDRPPRRLTDSRFVENQLGASQRLAHGRRIERREQPAAPIALIGLRRDAPAQVQRALRAEQRHQALHRRTNLLGRQMHDDGLADDVVERAFGNADQ